MEFFLVISIDVPGDLKTFWKCFKTLIEFIRLVETVVTVFKPVL